MSLILRSAVAILFAVLLVTALAQEIDLNDLIQDNSTPAATDPARDAAKDILLDLVDPATQDAAAGGPTVVAPADAADPPTPEPPTPETSTPETSTPETSTPEQVPLLNDVTDAEPVPSKDDLDRQAEADQAFGSFVRSRPVILDRANGIDGAIGTLDRETGRLNPTSALTVELYDEDSRRLKSIVTDVNGRFRLNDLAGGMYQLVAKGKNGFLAVSLMVIERASAPAADLGQQAEQLFLVQAPMNTRDSIEVISAAVPPTFNQIRAILKLHYRLTLPDYMLPESSSLDDVTAQPEPAAASILDPDSPVARDALRAYEVPLLKGNRIQGRTYMFDPETGGPRKVSKVYIHIIHDDQPIGPPIPVNDNGEFEAELVYGPGAYSIVAAGEGGFGAAGFYARPEAEIEAENQGDREFFVSTELVQVDVGDPLNRGNIRRVPEGAKPSQMFGFALVTNDVLRSQLPAIVNGDGAVASLNLGDAESATEDFPQASPGVLPGGFARGGVALGSSRGRGFGALLVGSGVVAAIAISQDDNGRRPASPYTP